MWVLLDLLFYCMHLYWPNQSSSYEVLILCVLDVSLYMLSDGLDRVAVFHNLPKVYLLHIRNPLVLTIACISLLVLHVLVNQNSAKIHLFFMKVSLAVFLSSFGVSKIVALSFVTGVMASYIYLWDQVEPLKQEKPEDRAIRFD